MEDKKVTSNIQALLSLLLLNNSKGSLFIFDDDFEKWYNEMPLSVDKGCLTFEEFLKRIDR